MIGKKGKLTTKSINTAIIAIIVIVVMFKLYAALVPEAQGAGDELTDAGRCASAGGFWNVSVCHEVGNSSAPVDYTAVPLGGLFSGSGIVFVILMAALMIVIVRSVMPKGGK